MKDKKIARSIVSCILAITSFLATQMIVSSVIYSVISLKKPNFDAAAMNQYASVSATFANLLFLGLASIFYRCRKKRLVNEINYTSAKPSAALLAFIALLLFSFGFSFGVDAFGPEPMRLAFSEQAIGIFAMGAPMAIIGVVILQSIAEEVVFRGIVQKKLASHMSPIVALIISGVVFGAIHIVSSVYLLPFTIIGGLLFSYIFYHTGSIVPAMFAHIGANTADVVRYMLFGEALSKSTCIAIFAISMIACAITLFFFTKTPRHSTA